MKLTHSIIAGVYVLSTTGSACIVDAVSQVSAGDNPLIAVSVNKNNYTNQIMQSQDKFTLSILPKDINNEVIPTFGFESSKNIDKFANIEFFEKEGIKIIKNSIGYMILEKVNTIDCDTHTLFIGRLIMEERFKEKEELVYQYYQKNKEKYIKVKINDKKTVWICTVCGYIYEQEELPEDFKCPLCGVSTKYFKKQ